MYSFLFWVPRKIVHYTIVLIAFDCRLSCDHSWIIHRWHFPLNLLLLLNVSLYINIKRWYIVIYVTDLALARSWFKRVFKCIVAGVWLWMILEVFENYENYILLRKFFLDYNWFATYSDYWSYEELSIFFLLLFCLFTCALILS